jgi:hypothetical protein
MNRVDCESCDHQLHLCNATRLFQPPAESPPKPDAAASSPPKTGESLRQATACNFPLNSDNYGSTQAKNSEATSDPGTAKKEARDHQLRPKCNTARCTTHGRWRYVLGSPLTITHTDHHQALRALQNPALFTSEHYKQAALAVAIGIAIRLAIAIPVRMFPLVGNIGSDVVTDRWH